MKTKSTRAKALAACMSAFCVMTASWGIGNKAGTVSASQSQEEINNSSHIIDETLFPDPEFRAYPDALK